MNYYIVLDVAKTRGRGVLKGAVGYAGPREVTTQSLPASVAKDLRENEKRLGISKTALTAFAIRKVRLYQYSAFDIKQDIANAERELKRSTTTARRERWKPALAK